MVMEEKMVACVSGIDRGLRQFLKIGFRTSLCR